VNVLEMLESEVGASRPTTVHRYAALLRLDNATAEDAAALTQCLSTLGKNLDDVRNDLGVLREEARLVALAATEEKLNAQLYDLEAALATAEAALGKARSAHASTSVTHLPGIEEEIAKREELQRARDALAVEIAALQERLGPAAEAKYDLDNLRNDNPDVFPDRDG